MSGINILIADDHDLFRRSLRSLIESRPGWHVCGEAGDGREAVDRAHSLKPDVILLDVSMPEMNGLDAARLIRKQTPESQILIISQNDAELMQQKALDVGARAFIQKSRVSQELVKALEELTGEKGNGRQSVRAERASGSSALDFMTAEGEMAQRMRALDWSKTPLGPVERWPQSLKTSISICLASRFPIVMYWGPEYVVLYNDAYSTILGNKHPWALGQPCHICWSEIWDTIGPMLDGVVRAGEATWSDDLLLLLRRRGYPEECYFSFSFSPIRIETGVVGGVFTAVIETTDRVVGERRLRTLRDLAARAVDANSEPDALRVAIETLSENIYDLPFSILCEVGTDDHIRVLGTAGIDETHAICTALANPQSKLGAQLLAAARSREPVELKDLSEWDPLPFGAWKVSPRSALALPIGDVGPESASGFLIAALNPHKEPTGAYATFLQLVARQIATSVADARSFEQERRRAEALAELDRAKTVFFSNISHEFRTPLTLMMAPLEDAMAQSGSLSAENRERIELAHRNAQRLLKLVNTLLDFSRLEAGRIQASYEPVDLSRLTLELASVFRSTVERSGLRFTLDCEPLEEPVFVDREMWEKIVFNLLSNAFKFTLAGEINVALRKKDGAVELSVRDSGSGIAEKDLPHLFERFYRVQGVQSRSFEGSGIGLALVQELVKLHGGSVQVESEVGRGSAFTVTIPLGKDHLPAGRIHAARAIASTGLRGDAYVQEALRWIPSDLNVRDSAVSRAAAQSSSPDSTYAAHILLADDNADMRDYVCHVLREHYQVTAVCDGESALQSARQRRPDLIVTDIMMPQLDGIGLLQAVRQDESLKSVPVILLSARAGEESRIEGFDAGADDYLIKPFSARELLARVRSQLAMSGIRAQATETERRLRLDAELLASIVASSDDAIVSKNLDGVITSWNRSAERIFGYTAQEAIGQHITLIIPPERHDEEADIIARLRRGERVDHFQTVRRRKDGTLLDVSLTISPVRDAMGRVVGASKVARDITAQVRTEQILRQSEERFRKLSESLDAEVRARTRELEVRNADVLRQSDQLRDLSRRLLNAQDQERRRIARELHDSAGQTLTVLGMGLAQLSQRIAPSNTELTSQLGQAEQLVQQLHQEIRTMSYLLHPPLLDETGLAPALTWYVEGLTSRSGLEISLSISDFDRLPRDMELVVFRVVQECLTNIHRHSGSKKASIRIEREGTSLTVEVQDQGRGMSPERMAELQTRSAGLGLRGMRERVRQLEGEVQIDSGKSGTRVLVTIPLPRSMHEEEQLETFPAAS